MYNQAFAPLSAAGNLGNAIVIATSTSAAGAALRANSASSPNGILISNFSSGWLFLNFGNASVSAAAVPVSTNIPITAVPPNSASTFIVDPSVTNVSTILSTGSGVCIINLGEGM